MAWSTSNRRARLPSNWEALRKQVLERDHYRCQWIVNGKRCLAPATEVDHRKAMMDDNRPEALRSLCTTHHRRKSSQEGHEAKAAKKAEIHSKFRRREERHPGSL